MYTSNNDAKKTAHYLLSITQHILNGRILFVFNWLDYSFLNIVLSSEINSYVDKLGLTGSLLLSESIVAL